MPSLNDPLYDARRGHFSRRRKYEIFAKGSSGESVGFVYADDLARAQAKLDRLPSRGELYVWLHLEPAPKMRAGIVSFYDSRDPLGGMSKEMFDACQQIVLARGTTGRGFDE